MGIPLRTMGLTMKYSDNFWKLKRQLKTLENGNTRITTATVSNTAKHATVMDAKEGFFVVSNEALYAHVHAELRDLYGRGSMGVRVARGSILVSEREVENAVARGIIQYINWLRSVIGTKPPVKNSGPRNMHPGGWADITGLLDSAWRYKINDGPWEAEAAWLAGKRRAARNFKKIYGTPRTP